MNVILCMEKLLFSHSPSRSQTILNSKRYNKAGLRSINAFLKGPFLGAFFSACKCSDCVIVRLFTSSDVSPSRWPNYCHFKEDHPLMHHQLQHWIFLTRFVQNLQVLYECGSHGLGVDSWNFIIPETYLCVTYPTLSPALISFRTMKDMEKSSNLSIFENSSEQFLNKIFHFREVLFSHSFLTNYAKCQLPYSEFQEHHFQSPVLSLPS